MRLPEGGDDNDRNASASASASASRLSASRSAHLATTTLQVGGMTCVATSYPFVPFVFIANLPL
jgi:Cu+-exporting ATPase